MNNTIVGLFLPESRFDPNKDSLHNNLIEQSLNMNSRFMKEGGALEETVYVDEAVIIDDTTNWFMRQEW